MSGKTCACTGHRPRKLPFGLDESSDLCVELQDTLRNNIEKLILQEGVTHFISGMALGVDTYFAEIVIELRNDKYPKIKLEAAIPCETQAIHWTDAQRDKYYSIVEQCDVEHMIQTGYTRDCMQKRNRYMVDCCDFLIAVWDGSPSGTGSTVRYAKRKNKSLILIDPNHPIS